MAAAGEFLGCILYSFLFRFTPFPVFEDDHSLMGGGGGGGVEVMIHGLGGLVGNVGIGQYHVLL